MCSYRVRNWNQYNTALVQRGSLTLWFDKDAIVAWQNQEQTAKRGAPKTYSDTAIVCALTLAAVYHLPLRATQGMLKSVVAMLGLSLPVPDYSTLSRRRQGLKVALPQRKKNEPIHVVIDSTGLKLFGEGEWKVRQHGYSKRRTWRKLHLGIDEATGEIVAAALTESKVADGTMLPELLDQVQEPVKQVSADGSYDWQSCYEAIQERGATATIPPPPKGYPDAVIWQHGNCKAEPLPRDENLRAIRKQGRGKWKQASGYHRRSLAETGMFRMKSLFGSALSARLLASQQCEALVRCAALNKLTELGMPQSYAV
jgi:hypothetical protein